MDGRTVWYHHPVPKRGTTIGCLKPSKRNMAIKRDKYDKAVSDLVRERADWTCERCGSIDVNAQAMKASRVIQASHFRGRGKGNISRYDTDNIRALCGACHNHLEGAPDEHTAFIAGLLGDAAFENMITRCSQVHKWAAREKQDMLAHFKKELTRLTEARRKGKSGYIEVVGWF